LRFLLFIRKNATIAPTTSTDMIIPATPPPPIPDFPPEPSPFWPRLFRRFGGGGAVYGGGGGAGPVLHEFPSVL
jgi:hypothetical protein